jgi:hypothetical protein
VDRVLAVLLAAVLMLGAVGCSSSAPTSASGVDPYAAIPSDGPHEKVALAAVPAALASVRGALRAAGGLAPDVTDAAPTLFGYTLEAVVGDRFSLLEVRADGRARELDRYPSEPDSAGLYWQVAVVGEGADLPAPQGFRETAAASAVRSVVGKAVPNDTVQVRMYGYTFCFIKDAHPITTVGPAAGRTFQITVDPHGNAGSWSQ